MRSTVVLVSLVASLVLVGRGGAQDPSRPVAGAKGLIAFIRSSSKDRTATIWIMNADGAAQRSLGPAVNFEWSPDGQMLAVLRNDGIYIVSVKGGPARRLTRGVQIDWSPDGRKIAFARDAVYVIDMDGRGTQRRTSPPPSSHDSEPEWSPDGRKIAWVRTFISGGGERRQPFVMNADGSGQRKLTRRIDPYSLAWSPDGRSLAADCWAGNNYDIYVISADGSRVQNLTPTLANDIAPDWSPDGTRIAFTSQAGPDASEEVRVIRRDGTGRRQLTHARGFDGGADWSPDGRSIAFISERDGNLDVYAMTAGGQRQTNLTRSQKGVDNAHPVWAPPLR